MIDILIVLLVLALSVWAASITFDRLRLEFLFASGAEYLLIGILLGPQATNILSAEVADSLAPIPCLALGWIGARVGARLVIADLRQVAWRAHAAACLESVGTLVVVTLAMMVVLDRWLDLPLDTALLPATALGAMAINVAAPRSRALPVHAAWNDVIATLAFGFLIGFGRAVAPGETVTQPLVWIAISIATGLAGGTLFWLFLGDERKNDRLFISLLGAVTLVSGAAMYLRTSPLLSAMCFGVVLVNGSALRNEIRDAFAKAEPPLYFGLLVFGGAEWQAASSLLLLPVAAYVVIRAAAKQACERASNRIFGVRGAGIASSPLAQGGLVVALAVNYVYQASLPQSQLVLTVAIAAVLVTDLAATRRAERAGAPVAQ